MTENEYTEWLESVVLQGENPNAIPPEIDYDFMVELAREEMS